MESNNSSHTRELLSHSCPNLVARISSDLGQTGLHYWTKLGRTQITKSHEACTPGRCNANEAESRHGAVTHVEISCRCAPVGPEMVKVAKIMAANMIPVVAVRGSGKDPYLVVDAYKPGLVFTVISHSYSLSDCFGNSSENKLPTCQVNSIREIISRLPSIGSGTQQHWFWIDTLCVPLQYTRQPSTQQIVAKSMKSISQRATQTIVIDSDILRLTSTSDPKEVFVRIAYCSWSSRLWTLQEAVYAQRLLFHFSDQDVDLDTLMRKYGNLPPEWELAWLSRLPYKKLREFLNARCERRCAGSNNHRLLLLRSLEGRTTSDAVGEPVVLADLLGIDQEAIETRTLLSGSASSTEK
ncbi:hypothetical protein TCE0_033f09572 [Talaromyces pinophilus]|uniref:Heterokaryon incompatibility domain-containing protein n=1 Tax=Talaromyces pinophilus TaxID=128442 RepID=A0A6V8HC56_TALPI|nr:hypothetical protein TCE0_033f09572 [Talaromyces pinophilus]